MDLLWNNSNIQLGVALLIGGIVILYVKGQQLSHRWFASLNAAMAKKKTEGYKKLKDELLKPISEIISHVPDLREKKAVRVLEIGVGTGTNFSNYPEGSHLVVVDPNPFFAKYYNENRKKFPNIISEDIYVMKGEEMDCVEDESIDAVVVTQVLCSVTDVTKVLQQIHRVLVPNGKFFFLEHIREWDDKEHGLRRRLQDFLTLTRIWPFFLDGCCLNRDPVPAMHAAGFTDITCSKLYAPMPYRIFDLASPHVSGVATK